MIHAITKGGTYADLIEIMDHDAAVAKVDYESKQIGNNRLVDEWGITSAKGLMQATVAMDEFALIHDLEGP